ncbi:MAG: hypothetical protein IKG98_00210 [Ruminococcus sp.]|nr:hypothetical protein [Ruminococcus sp.]
MSGIIKRSDYSYRITNEPETNEDGNIYVFNGIRLDNSGNKETVKILFVRRTLRFVDFQRYGSATKICKLPESFYDERFNKKYGIDSASNGLFDLYIAVKPSHGTVPEPEKSRLPKLLIIAAAVLIVLLLLIFGAVKLAGVLGGDKPAPPTDSTAETTSLGDLNGDGLINSIDASMVLSNYNKVSTGEDIPESELARGDLNGDGRSDASDASLILAYYSFMSSSGDMTLDEYLDSRLGGSGE